MEAKMHNLLLAQVVAVPIEGTDPTFLGTVYTLVASLVGLGVLAAMALLAKWLGEKAKDSKAARVALNVWELAQAVVAHVEVHIRPTIREVLADGKLTADEGKRVKAEALKLLREALGEHGLKELKGALGLFGPQVEVYLSGVIERALGIQRAVGTLPPPAPATRP
jgi:hypothetical protein